MMKANMTHHCAVLEIQWGHFLVLRIQQQYVHIVRASLLVRHR